LHKTILQILKDISEIIASNGNQNKVRHEIVRILAENLSVDVCSIYIYDENSDKLVLDATWGLKQESIGNICLPPGAGITGSAFASREIINLASANEHEKYQYFPNSGEELFKAFLACPLIIGSVNVGVLDLQKKESGQFPDAVVDMVKALSPQIANLILSSKMLSELTCSCTECSDFISSEKQIILKGVSINYGVVSGLASVYMPNDLFDVPEESHHNQDAEIKIFDRALSITKSETVKLLEKAISIISEADAAIFDVHLVLLEDQVLLSEIKDRIKSGASAEYAVHKVNAKFQNLFNGMQDEVFREKSADLKDVMLRLLKNIRNIKSNSIFTDETLDIQNKIIVAKELLPSDIFRLTSGSVTGIVTEKGSATSHVAILAKALNIPTLLGVKNLMSNIREGDSLILDCNTSLCYINPELRIAEQFNDIISGVSQPPDTIEIFQSVTRNGKKIYLRANISLVSETALLEKYNADGIGLYRTEFLFMIRDLLPSEQVQYNIFSAIIKNTVGKEVAFRLLDVGGDKPLPYLKHHEESNPALGKRGIRLLLEREDILRPHIKAMLRAGAEGVIKIICPMVSTLSEYLHLKIIVDECIDELKKNNIPYCKNFKLGIMLEVPSAYINLKRLILEVDCVSIGTNDLFQYTFACDREIMILDAAPGYLQPPFLSMLKNAADIVSGAGKDISICGEMAADPLALPLILGAGIYDLSMQPAAIPGIAENVASYSMIECVEIFNKAINCIDAKEVLNLLKDFHELQKK